MYSAKFTRFASLAAGATGLLSGLVYHKISTNGIFLISAADEVVLDIEKAISKNVESFVDNYAPAMRHGFPSYDCLRLKENFVLSYDRRNRNANWVMEHLTSEDLAKGESVKSRKRKRVFREDETIHDYFRTTKDDYKYSGYDKGHLAAAGNHKHSLVAWNDTFIMSNISPQNEFFNQGIWERLESHVRNLVKEHGSAYVCTGPLYLPRELSIEEEEFFRNPVGHQKKRKRGRNQAHNESVQQRKKYVIYEVIGENNIAVPTHFFKIIAYETTDEMYNMEAYVIPNEPIDSRRSFTDFIVPREVIERYAGFLLFHQLPSKNIRHITGERMDVV